MQVLELQGLSKNYGQRRGIEGINLSVNSEEIFGFLGPNGAGKTTTIRVLLGLLRPSQGTAKILGHDCWSQSALIKQHIGYLPGDLRLYPWFTGKNALKIVSEVRGQSEVRQRGSALLEQFQLDENVPVRRMSRGMRQKLGIVLALAHRPRLLILDEPTSGLDPLMCDELYRTLRDAATTGTTVFFSSHTLSEVESLCERVAIVRAGQIVADEKMEVLRQNAHRTVMLRFRSNVDTAGLQLPNFLKIKQRTNYVWSGELTGTVSELVAWAAGQPLDDLELSPPSLESLFHAYYQSDQEPA